MVWSWVLHKAQSLRRSLWAFTKCRNLLVGKVWILPSYAISMLIFLLCLSLMWHVITSWYGLILSIQCSSLPVSWNLQTLQHIWTFWSKDQHMVSLGGVLIGIPTAPRDTKLPWSTSLWTGPWGFVNRAQRIFSPCILPVEMEKIMNILGENGYLEYIIKRYVHKFLNMTKDRKLGPHNCPVYIRMPWKGRSSRRFEEQIKHMIWNTYLAVQPRVIFTSRRLLPSVNKDVLPTSQISNVINEFKCRCEALYVGRTAQRLADRIKHHVPLAVREKNFRVRTQLARARRNVQGPSAISCSSTIAQHLVANPIRADQYNADMFKILSRGRSVLHLLMLEATFIFSMDPVFCRQKEFVHSLILFQHGNIKAVALTAVQGTHANGESPALGDSHPPAFQGVGANS